MMLSKDPLMFQEPEALCLVAYWGTAAGEHVLRMYSGTNGNTHKGRIAWCAKRSHPTAFLIFII